MNIELTLANRLIEARVAQAERDALAKAAIRKAIRTLSTRLTIVKAKTWPTVAVLKRKETL